VDAFPDDTTPAYLLRDRDSVYGGSFRQRVKSLRICEVLTAATESDAVLAKDSDSEIDAPVNRARCPGFGRDAIRQHAAPELNP